MAKAKAKQAVGAASAPTGETRPGVKPPKGRPTPGRKQRNEGARRRARRHRMIVRLWWAGFAILIVGGFVAMMLLTGNSPA
jgi:hypothetical protein